MRWVGSEAVYAMLDRVDREPGPDSEPAVQAARLLGSLWVVSGAYQRVGERLRVTARVIEVATGTVRHAATVDGLLTALFSLQDALASALRQGSPFGGTGDAAAVASRGPAGGVEPVAETPVLPSVPSPPVSRPAEPSPVLVSGSEATPGRVKDGLSLIHIRSCRRSTL